MSESDPNPFQRKVMTRQPGIIGAQWWNEGLSAVSDPVTRRKALQALAALGGTVALGGMAISALSGEDEDLESFDSLKMQGERGWNFGATDDPLTFANPVSNSPVKYAELRELATELTPKQDTLKPFYQATLFQSVVGYQGVPTLSARSLWEALRPIYTPGMDVAFKQGQALADLFAKQEETTLTTAVLVDLPGPESVAFAAALASRFEPVFTFDNWPHPLGVVPAHLTLAAAVYYQATFRQLAQQRRLPAPPVFVLDRQRLSPFNNEAREFDNRYVAKVPTAEQLRKLGLQRVLYVVPGGSTPLQELDDLNEDFVAWRAAGLDVKLVAANDFRPDPTEPVAPAAITTAQKAAMDGGTPTAVAATPSTDAGTPSTPRASSPPTPPPQPYYYGGSRAAHTSFWSVYPWGHPSTSSTVVHGIATAGVLSAAALALAPSSVSGGYAYEPMRRSTMFSSLPRGANGAPRQLPPRFGKVAMRVSTQSRAILGPNFTSRSSWNRSSSSSGG
jgi:hypothetical protein